LLGSQIDFQERRTRLRFDHNQRPIQETVSAITEFSLGLRAPQLLGLSSAILDYSHRPMLSIVCDAFNETNRSMTRFGCLFE
jgi:hypothetical protein